MKPYRAYFNRILLLAAFALATAALFSAPPAFADDASRLSASKQTELDRYVAKADPSYAWKLVKTIPGDGYTGYVIDLTSQTWRSAPEVSLPVWKHWLIVIKPTKVSSNKALMFISGGNNKDVNPPGKVDETWAGIAKHTDAVVAELRMIPNQPIIFNSDGKERTEDDLLAYTWDEVMRTGDETWSGRMPMVKAGVRAMDTITAFMGSPDGGKIKVDQFVVSGGSKRGWTTWLVGAVDARVVAIVPIVIDILNAQESMKHHYAAYGFWAPAVGNYVDHKIMDWIGTPEYAKLLAMEDPYSYRERLTIPKYIMCAGGDEFFLPDSSQFYFGDLKGEKYLRYVPNTKHSMQGSDARESVEAFFGAVVKGKERPKFSWTMEKDGSIKVVTKDKPLAVNLWQATNPKARDFRLDIIGKAYSSTKLEDQGGGVYVGKVEKPAEGWTAFFVELLYDSGGTIPFKFTTQVNVVPDVLPFKDKPIPKSAPVK